MEKLLTAVAQAIEKEQDTYTDQGWRLERVYGGMNGIIYRAESSNRQLAVKIRKRGTRQRAWREFSALKALQQLPEPVAPEPISLHTDMTKLPGDAVITSWVEGTVLGDLSDAPLEQWERILAALSRVHSVNQSDTLNLPIAVVSTFSYDAVVGFIYQRFVDLPAGQLGDLTKADIGKLFDEFRHDPANIVPSTETIRLIICDTNPNNMIERDGRIVLVDCENAGWGDPAFDLADLLVRPNCAGLSDERKRWIVSRYAELMGIPHLIDRILAYERLLLVFWLILTSNGFAQNKRLRFKGTRQFTHEESLQQQREYIKRIDAARIR